MILLTQSYIIFWNFVIKEDIYILPLPAHAASGRALMKYVPVGDNEEQQRLQSQPSLQRESVWNMPSHEATQNQLGNRQYTVSNNDTLTLPKAMDPKDGKKLSIEETGITTRTRQYLEVVDDYASTVGNTINLDTGDNSYQYKHEDNFKTAPASMMDLGGLTMWEDLHELGSTLFEVPERNVPARNNCLNDHDRAKRSTDSNIVPPLERKTWAEQKQQQQPDRGWLQRERDYERDSDLDYPILAPASTPTHAPPQKGSELSIKALVDHEFILNPVTNHAESRVIGIYSDNRAYQETCNYNKCLTNERESESYTREKEFKEQTLNIDSEHIAFNTTSYETITTSLQPLRGPFLRGMETLMMKSLRGIFLQEILVRMLIIEPLKI